MAEESSQYDSHSWALRPDCLAISSTTPPLPAGNPPDAFQRAAPPGTLPATAERPEPSLPTKVLDSAPACTYSCSKSITGTCRSTGTRSFGRGAALTSAWSAGDSETLATLRLPIVGSSRRAEMERLQQFAHEPAHLIGGVRPGEGP